MNEHKTPRVVAEIGCNHKGDMDIAREMIETAARFCKADFVKFQKRCNRELLTPEEFEALHQDQIETDLIPANPGDILDELSDEDPAPAAAITGADSSDGDEPTHNPVGGDS